MVSQWSETRELFEYIFKAQRLVPRFAKLTIFFAIAGLVHNYVVHFSYPEGARTTPSTAIFLTLIGVMLLAYRPKTPSPVGTRVVASTIALLCLLRVVEIIMPVGVLPIADILSPREGGIVTGRFGVESAVAIGSLCVAGICRRSKWAVGEAFLLVACGCILFTVMQQIYGHYIFGPDVSIFSILAQTTATTGMICVYSTRRTTRGAFLKSSIGRQTRFMAAFTVFSITLIGLMFNLMTVNSEQIMQTSTVLLASIAVVFLGMVFHLGRIHENSDFVRRQIERKMNLLNHTDSLTGIMNRHGALEKMAAAWGNFVSHGTKYGVVLVDLDHFKNVNDIFGHSAGDEVLCRVGKALRTALRPTDMVGRWGGEEFVVLLDLSGNVAPLDMGERLRAAIEDAKCGVAIHDVSVAPKPVNVTASVGVSEFLDADTSFMDALERSDQSMYLAKSKGRNRVIAAEAIAA